MRSNAAVNLQNNACRRHMELSIGLQLQRLDQSYRDWVAEPLTIGRHLPICRSRDPLQHLQVDPGSRQYPRTMPCSRPQCLHCSSVCFGGPLHQSGHRILLPSPHRRPFHDSSARRSAASQPIQAARQLPDSYVLVDPAPPVGAEAQSGPASAGYDPILSPFEEARECKTSLDPLVMQLCCDQLSRQS